MGKYVGTFIKEYRVKRGLSQADVARLLKLKTAQSISNIERGISPLPRTKIKRLAGVLGVEKQEIVTILLREVQDRYSKAVGVRVDASEGASSAMDDLSAEERKVLQSVVERLRSANKPAQRHGILRKIERAL